MLLTILLTWKVLPVASAISSHLSPPSFLPEVLSRPPLSLLFSSFLSLLRWTLSLLASLQRIPKSITSAWTWFQCSWWATPLCIVHDHQNTVPYSFTNTADHQLCLPPCSHSCCCHLLRVQLNALKSLSILHLPFHPVTKPYRIYSWHVSNNFCSILTAPQRLWIFILLYSPFTRSFLLCFLFHPIHFTSNHHINLPKGWL